MEKRIDSRTAMLIDAAVNAATITGPIAAARELAEHGIPLEIAIRVLTRPWERRRYSLMQTATSLE